MVARDSVAQSTFPQHPRQAPGLGSRAAGSQRERCPEGWRKSRQRVIDPINESTTRNPNHQRPGHTPGRAEIARGSGCPSKGSPSPSTTELWSSAMRTRAAYGHPMAPRLIASNARSSPVLRSHFARVR